jgi:hypothetical protein
MKTSFQKQSFGNGYGINRHVPAAQKLYAAVPAYRGAHRNPGSPNRKEIGQQGLKSFCGAKVIGGKKS